MGGGKRKPKPKPKPKAKPTGRRLSNVLALFSDDRNNVSPPKAGTNRKASRGSGKKASTSFFYTYPEEQVHSPIVLGSVDAPIIAFVDRSPCEDPPMEMPTYDYYSSVAMGEDAHVGLGFHIEEEEEKEELAVGRKSQKRGEGFLAIGGLKLYTEDVSGDSEDEVDSESSSKDDGSEEEWSDADSSEIDEEVMQDYLEGIGGASELFKGVCLEENLDALEGSDSEECDGESDAEEGKISGVALMKASEQYGMIAGSVKSRGEWKVGGGKNRGEWKVRSGGPPLEDVDILGLDDLAFGRDMRTPSWKKKSVSSRLSRSWPDRSYKSKRINSEKKKQRKALIAAKRRERMLNRGVDLEQINMKLRQLVIDDIDMFCFQPMHSRDCSQVRRLASIYRLGSGCHGSGKKRVVTVARSAHTCLPSAIDNLRLEKLLGLHDNNDDLFLSTRIHSAKAVGKARTWKTVSSLGKPTIHSHRNREGNGRKKQDMKESRSSYASKPVSFVSSGTMQVNYMEDKGDMPNGAFSDTPESISAIEPVSHASGSLQVGTFERHTKGFGSKMMSKMGYLIGSGLGKDGQGITQPIEVTKRPRSLGLGVQLSVTSESNVGISDAGRIEKEEKQQVSNDGKRIEGVGGFEKHTKGFGSRMMSRMGFVPGTGLGKDGQGITCPLTVVRLPKSKGLGS